MRKRSGVISKILIGVGAAVLVAAIGLFAYFKFYVEGSLPDNGEAVAFLESILPEKTVGIPEERANSAMPIMEYEKTDYVALLEIPAYSVKLPVLASWDKVLVRSVPCRFTGSTYDGTLIIGGTDTEGQFDFIDRIDIGDELSVTNMRGEVFSYTVTTVKHAKNTKAETLQKGDFDLTVFAKSAKTGDSVLVRCRIK